MHTLSLAHSHFAKAGDYTQKLGQRAKDMENQPRSEDPYHSPRYMHNSTKGESPRKAAPFVM